MDKARITILNAKKMVAVMVILLVVCADMLSVFKIPSAVLADDPISIWLSSDSSDDSNNPGDIVTVEVVGANISHITRFGVIEISYDASRMDYLSVSQPTPLSAFTYTIDSSEPGIIKVFAVNETVESDIEASGNNLDEMEDNSFSSEDEIVLFSISFRIMSMSAESVDVKLEDVGTFVDSKKKEQAVSVKEDSVSIPVTAELSPDAHLAFLTVNGYTLTPEFSSDVTDYSISVSRDANSVQISAIPVNLWANVLITGNTNLVPGDNLITIEITAQDNVNKNVYYIHASKQETYMTEGAGLIDSEGKIYTFVVLPPDYFVPDGFIETTKVVNGYSVPVLYREGVESFLVYISDGSSDPAFFFYNPNTKIVTPYVAGDTTVITSKILFRKELPEGVKVPGVFSSSTLYSKGIEYQGYINSDGVFICYMEDETGYGAFYKYNVETGTFSEYVANKSKDSSAYKFLFHVFLFATVIEAVIIVLVVFIVQYNINKRKNPRPKRV